MIRLTTQQKRAAKAVDKWNAKVAVGATVEYRDWPEGPAQTCTTKTPAEILSGHTAVVWLNEKRGCVCIDACKPLAA